MLNVRRRHHRDCGHRSVVRAHRLRLHEAREMRLFPSPRALRWPASEGHPIKPHQRAALGRRQTHSKHLEQMTEILDPLLIACLVLLPVVAALRSLPRRRL